MVMDTVIMCINIIIRNNAPMVLYGQAIIHIDSGK